MSEEQADAVISAATAKRAAAVEEGSITMPAAAPALISGVLLLLVLFACYIAASLIIPFVFAFILNFLFQPPLRVLTRIGIPRMLSGLIILVAFFSLLVALGSSIAVPAARWITRAPQSLAHFETRLEVLKRPLDRFQSAIREVEKITETPAAEAPAVTLAGPGFASILLTGTRDLLTGLLSMSILLYFLLIAGDLFLRRLVEILPTFRDKKQAVEISREIERNISIYLGTITLMNTAVGVLTGIETYFCGLPDPLLWAVVALLLNFILLLGPLMGIAVLTVVGLSTFDTVWHALLPAGLYLLIHLTESQLVTPMLLARRFILNPVAVIISLLFWYWMWGVAGALLAIPLLAIIKLTCDRIRPLMALGHFLEGEAHGAP